MKKYVFSLLIGLIVILTLSTCITWYRIPPTLISPEDGEVFYTDYPTFSWEEQERIDTYSIVIRIDSSLGGLSLISEKITTTSYTLDSTIFEYLPRGEYFWKVANILDSKKVWSKERYFEIDHDLPDLNLDTTFYPIKDGYKWVYQNMSDGYVEDTSIVEVTSVTKDQNKTYFSFTVSTQSGFDSRYDLSSSATIYGNVMYNRPGEVYPVWTSRDTLRMSRSWSGFLTGDGPWDTNLRGMRAKGIGLVETEEEWLFYSGNQLYEDRLLYFIKGEDTVWRHDG